MGRDSAARGGARNVALSLVGEEAGDEGAMGVCGNWAGVLLLTRETDRAIVNVGREAAGFSEGDLADPSRG